MPFTDAKVRNLKPSYKPAKISDGGWLHKLVTPNGSKLWRLAYRFAGKQKTLTIGSFPDVSLEMARTDARQLLALGIDPSEQKRLKRLKKKASSANTFRAIGDSRI